MPLNWRGLLRNRLSIYVQMPEQGYTPWVRMVQIGFTVCLHRLASFDVGS